jgi:hypothetical protein
MRRKEATMIHRLILFGMLAGLLLAACALGPRPVHQTVFPTIGPVRHVSGLSTAARVELTASTNCAEVGEVVTFTTQITNEMSIPMTLRGLPPLDILLKSAVPGAPPQRWSATPQYPKAINPVLAPGEVRMYEWQWVADAAYAQLEQTTYNGVEARLELGGAFVGEETIAGGSIAVYVGVGAHVLPQPGTNVRCADMHQ